MYFEILYRENKKQKNWDLQTSQARNRDFLFNVRFLKVNNIWFYSREILYLQYCTLLELLNLFLAEFKEKNDLKMVETETDAKSVKNSFLNLKISAAMLSIKFSTELEVIIVIPMEIFLGTQFIIQWSMIYRT